MFILDPEISCCGYDIDDYDEGEERRERKNFAL